MRKETQIWIGVARETCSYFHVAFGRFGSHRTRVLSSHTSAHRWHTHRIINLIFISFFASKNNGPSFSSVCNACGMSNCPPSKFNGQRERTCGALITATKVRAWSIEEELQFQMAYYSNGRKNSDSAEYCHIVELLMDSSPLFCKRQHKK